MHTTRECGVLDAVPPERRAHSRLEVTRCCSTQQSTHKHTRHTHTHTQASAILGASRHMRLSGAQHTGSRCTPSTPSQKNSRAAAQAHMFVLAQCTHAATTTQQDKPCRRGGPTSTNLPFILAHQLHATTPAARYRTSAGGSRLDKSESRHVPRCQQQQHTAANMYMQDTSTQGFHEC